MFKYLKREKRKPYYGSKAIDKTCRNHGSCSHCWSNRTYSNNIQKIRALEMEASND